MRLATWFLSGYLLLMTACQPDYSSEEQAVLETLHEMFAAMQANDVDRSRALLIEGGQYHNYSVHKGAVSVGEFDEYVSSLKDSGTTLREHLLPPIEVAVSGPVAMVLSRYEFYVNDTFSHCGDEVFTFLKLDGKWVITGSTYTVDKENCN